MGIYDIYRTPNKYPLTNHLLTSCNIQAAMVLVVCWQDLDGSKRGGSTQSTGINRKSWRAMKSAEDGWTDGDRVQDANQGMEDGYTLPKHGTWIAETA